MPNLSDYRLAELCEFVGRGSSPVYVENSKILAIGQRCVRDKFNPLDARPHSPKHMAGTLTAKAGDILLNSTGTGTIGRSCIFPGHGDFIVDGHVTVIRPKPKIADSKYLLELIRGPKFQREMEVYCFSGSTNQIELSRSALLELVVSVPAIQEQRRIAEILDEVDRQIQLNLAEDEKYEIMFQSLLDQLIGQKLHNPSPGWVRTTLGDALAVLRDGTHLPPPRVSQGVPLLSVQNIISNSFVRTENDTFVPESFYRSMHKNWEIKPGDVLLAIVGATLGKCAQVQPMEKFTIQRSLAVFRGKEHVLDNSFLFYLVRTRVFQSNLWSDVNQTAQPGIYLDTLKNLKISCPAMAQQRAMVEFLRSFELKISNNRDWLRKLNETKSGLISKLIGGMDA